MSDQEGKHKNSGIQKSQKPHEPASSNKPRPKPKPEYAPPPKFEPTFWKGCNRCKTYCEFLRADYLNKSSWASCFTFFPLCVLQIIVPLYIYTFSLEVCFQITLLIREFTWHLMFYSCLTWAYHFCCIYLKGIVVNITYSKTKEFVNFD